jgi:NAD(P)-dependent dehydrogenase (short-subunit alcohol dehydrogenase family)
VLIFGGSRGLGLDLARRFSGEGADVALAARDPDELARAGRDVPGAMLIPCDVRDRAQVEQAVASVVARWGRLDVLVNDAGIIQVGPIDNMGVHDFEEGMAVHFWGPLHAIRAALPTMRAAGWGRIVNISSIGGKVAVPHMAPYVASKFALAGLSDALRPELACDGIRVTTVCPWLTRTGSARHAQVKGDHPSEYAWFAVSSALPGLTMSSEESARRIVEAARTGDARLVLGPWGKAAVAIDALAPELYAFGMELAVRGLPAPVGPAGDTTREGRDVPLPPFAAKLTRPADVAAARHNE